ADEIARPIHDHGEQSRNVASQHAHIENGKIGKGGKLRTSSSHRYHSPLICIDPGYLLSRDIDEEASIIRGVCCRGASQSFFGSVGDEELLGGDTEALAAILSVDFGSMGLEPGRVPV